MTATSATFDLAAFLELERLPASMMQAIHTVYEPLANRIAASASRPRSYIVGLCGPQGSGKSTLTTLLAALVRGHGLSVAALSLDDFYLTRAEREQLALHVHPLLKTRGVPGTHDVVLGMNVLDALARCGATALPAFDKASDDRRPASSWVSVATPVDIVLFEGWFVGARPQALVELETPVNDLERVEDPHGIWRRFVNDALASSYQPLFSRIDTLVLLTTQHFDVVFEWRAEQEQELRERLSQSGGDTSQLMDRAMLNRFVEHFERLTRHVMRELPSRADVVIELDRNRAPQRVLGLDFPRE